MVGQFNTAPYIIYRVITAYEQDKSHNSDLEMRNFDSKLPGLTVAPVFACLSLPAKSTRFNFPTRIWFSSSAPIYTLKEKNVKSEIHTSNSHGQEHALCKLPYDRFYKGSLTKLSRKAILHLDNIHVQHIN